MIKHVTADVAVRKHHQLQDEILIFLQALYWNQQGCFSLSNIYISNKHMLCEMRLSIARVQAYAVQTELHWVSRAYILHDRFFWKQLLDEMLVKIILISSSCWWRFVTVTFAIQKQSQKMDKMYRLACTQIAESAKVSCSDLFGNDTKCVDWQDNLTCQVSIVLQDDL